MKMISRHETFANVWRLADVDPLAAFNEYVAIYRQHDWLSDYRVQCSYTTLGLDGVGYVHMGHFSAAQLEQRQYQFTFHEARPRIILHLIFTDVRYDPKTFKTIDIDQLCFEELVEVIPLYWRHDNYLH